MAKIKRINLALQGGGAHGAFTWGVLDRLLEDDTIEVAGISGTSAGALNGAALKAGLVADGEHYNRAAAKENLDWLWHKVAGVKDLRLTSWMSIFSPHSAMISQALENSPLVAISDVASKVLSPYDYGLFYSNPLRDVVDKFDFERVCSKTGPAFFVCATNVRSGKIRVFQDEDISTDAILASACLPTLFKAVEIDDPKTGKREAYWDGGYTGNPALFPLFDPALPQDVVIVNINPLHREDLPRSANEIHNRINEISFNSSLLRELRAIHLVKRLIGDGILEAGKMRDVLVHMIADDDFMQHLNVATKIVATPVMVSRLKEAGRAAATRFLEAHHDALNKRSTVDLEQMYS